MSPDLTQEFEHLNTRLEQMVERVKQMPDDQQKRPVGKSFAPVLAVAHMAVTEDIYLGLIRKTKPERIAGKKGKPNFIYGLVIKNMLKPKGKTIPSPAPFIPKSDTDLEQAAADWRASRAEVIAYLAKFDDNEAAVKHPFMGLLSPRDLFILEEKHQDYHDARLE